MKRPSPSPIALKLLSAGLCAAGLAACASTPAQRANVWRAPNAPEAAPPFDPSAPPHIVADAPPSQCAPYARLLSGIEIYGDANTWWTQAEGRYPRSSAPAPGSVLVLRGYNDPSRGHVAVVTAVLGPRLIKVDQANWLNQGEVSVAVPVADVSPANDWSEVRVWYIPAEQWGARIYAAEGFIHPFPFFAGS